MATFQETVKIYKKRPGTAGVRGHLYETKLISILQFRAQNNRRIEEFQLATNVADAGAFDDICIRAKVKGFDRPIAIFIQAKHKEKDQTLKLLNSRDLTKYFESYLLIRRAFEQSKNELLFDGHFEDVECLFVMYTTASDSGTEVAPLNNTVNLLNELIGTGMPAYQTTCNNDHVEFLTKMAVKEEITALAVQIAKYICGEVNCRTMLNNELVLRYHVLLAQRVFQTSPVQSDGYRTLTLRENFEQKDFKNDEYLLIFKNALYLEILKRQNNDVGLSNLFLKSCIKESPSAQLLSDLIGSVVTFDDGKLKFVNSSTFSEDMKRKLESVYVSAETVSEAIELGAMKVLTSCELRVPAAFGNSDLTLRGSETKINHRMDYLISCLCRFIDQVKPDHVIKIDDSENGFLRLNGGIGSAVGNVLVHDADTKLLKFTENSQELEKYAKTFFEKLTTRIKDVNKYRIEVKANMFPKLAFDCREQDKALVQDFLTKLVFFTNQADESGVGEILRYEIEEQQSHIVSNLKVRSEAIFLKYHDEIQKWWLSPGEGPYLTERTETYKDAISSIVKDPLISIMHMIYRNKTKNIDYTFKEDAVATLKFQDQIATSVVVSRSISLTTAKVIQYFKRRRHFVIDLEHVSHLSADDCNSLCAELQTTSKETLLILTCAIRNYSRHWCKVVEKIASAVHDIHTIIVTNEASEAYVKQYFSFAFNDIINDRNNLIDMTEQTQVSILENGSIMFQGQQLDLNAMFDDESKSFIDGDVLNKVVAGETIIVGKHIGNPSYDEIKHLYVKRRLCRGRVRPKLYRDLLEKDTDILIETFHDVADDVVLVTAKPGMGKSTLLTHLSLNTKDLDPKIWIVRINLLEYSREFNEWQQKKTVIDTLETIRFMCQVILSDKQCEKNKVTIALEETNGVIRIKDTSADEHTVFELKMFLHFYNTDKIIFLFDGFDEICPHYTKEVLNMLKIVRSFPKKHKMWVASRSYNIIKSILQKEFGTAYEIQPFSVKDQDEYLEKFWKSNLILEDFDSAQLKNAYAFIDCVTNEEFSTVISSSRLRKLQFIPLYYIFFSALEHFRRAAKYSYIPKWSYYIAPIKNPALMLILLHCNGNDKETNDMLKFKSTPLHLYLLADYFQNEIKDVHVTNKWNPDLHMFSIYERFLETKLKRIRFQEKNRMDIYNPDIILTYDKERKDFIYKHKKLAAYALFHRYNHSLFSRKQLKEIKKTLKLIKRGGEKTGVIYSVTNNIPIFIHMTFAEYFAVEYVCDILKNAPHSEHLIYFIFHTIFNNSPANVLNILDSKIKMDDALSLIFRDNEKAIFDILIEQSNGYVSEEFDDYDDRFFDVKKFDSSFNRAVVENLSNFVEFYCSIHDKYLTEANLDNFIDMVHETKMTTSALSVICDEFLHFAINVVRKIDKRKIGRLFNTEYWVSIFTNYENLCNEEIIELHRTHMSLGISPVFILPNQFD